MANRLAGETSPYLLQHADNPVEWYPWGEGAFRRAREEDKPVFLSIGYAACHWCHVMEEESFEDEETARYLNEHFVSIKVDREEHPDLDDIYMQAVVRMTGRGGWPMSVWLTPDGSPFIGGTYYPGAPRMGMPSFRQVLEFVVAKWEEERDRVDQTAEELTGLLRDDAGSLGSAVPTLDEGISDRAVEDLEQYYDPHNGGWGHSPKFPQAMTVDFLLSRYQRTGDARVLAMVEGALQAMAAGGIYDQLGGGFHRYSVDAEWLVPHFEKMLYDNALLSRGYLHAYLVTGEETYRRVAGEVLDYVLREMADPGGGFYSTEDADSEGVEGKFFVWTAEEFRAALEALNQGANASLAADYFGVTETGNFEGKNVLHQAAGVPELAEKYGLPEEEVRGRLGDARRLLYQTREQRIRPRRDDKVLAGWNGLMLTSFAEAARHLGDASYLRAAEANAAFLVENMQGEDGRMIRSWREGKAAANGYLEDQAAVLEGMLALYQTTFNERWYRVAVRLAEVILERFAAPDGGFFDTSDDHEELIMRPRSIQDNAVPSGGALAAAALLELAALSGEVRYRSAAEEALKSVAGSLDNQAVMFGRWLTVLENAVGDPGGDGANRL